MVRDCDGDDAGGEKRSSRLSIHLPTFPTLSISILRKLKHENIIAMLDSFESPQVFCVVTEFAQGELSKILEDDECLPEEQVRALHYLHSNRIIHRDMKPQNILIGSGSVVKRRPLLEKTIRATSASHRTESSQAFFNRPFLLLQKILDHAKSSGVLNCLCLCLESSGLSFISGSTNLLRSACESCRGIWSLIDAFELLSAKGNELFPLNSFRSHSLIRLAIKDCDEAPSYVTDLGETIDSITKAFLKSKAIQVAIYFCLHPCHEIGLSAGMQLILRCCIRSDVMTNILCGLPSKLPMPTVVSGGADGTIISEIFSVLSFCATSNKETNDTGADHSRLKITDTRALVMHSCLVLATVAQCLKSSGRNSSLFMLTTNSKKQFSRLSILAHHFSSDERMQSSLQPSCAAAMLAFASILSLEKGPLVENTISEMALPLIPRTATLCDHLRGPAGDENFMNLIMLKGMLPCRHGIKDGFIGLLESRLNWGGPLAVQQLCASGAPQLLIDLLANNPSNASQKRPVCSQDQIGLSPGGVVWTVSSICRCLSGGVSTFCQILLRTEHVSAPGLLSTNASVNSGFLLNMGSPGGKVCVEDIEMMKTIQASMKKYIQILEETVLLKAKMLLNSPCPREVTMDFLMIVSDLARMDKAFYKYIDAANILEDLRHFLSHEDPNVRSKTCSAIGNMCRHSSYFYNSLAKRHIISSLVDRCVDPDKRTRKFACFAVGNAAYHNDSLYDELRRVIPQLKNVLIAEEEHKTKANAAGALSNLVRNSNRLCEDIVSSGAMQVRVAKGGGRLFNSGVEPPQGCNKQSPLKIALFSLVKMCAYPQCRQFICSSEQLPLIAHLRRSPEPAIANYASVIISKASDSSS
ncbi:hypothetical protein ACS0TY_032223 [Phlomoides rotata]